MPRTPAQACQRSVYPWDIVVQRIGGRLIFDKRDNSQIDFVSVNETSNEQAGEERESINSPQSLAQEATTINRYFSQQILVKVLAPSLRNCFQASFVRSFVCSLTHSLIVHRVPIRWSTTPTRSAPMSLRTWRRWRTATASSTSVTESSSWCAARSTVSGSTRDRTSSSPSTP